MKKKIASLIILIVLMFGLSLSALAEYAPMEPIPGTPRAEQNTFPTYVQAIYKFAVWAVAIASLLMVSIGGFMYFTSAGNNSKMEQAKNVIYDALYGLIAVLVAWVVLHTINPNLVNVDLGASIRNIRPQQDMSHIDDGEDDGYIPGEMEGDGDG
jgi:hypothetical protein